MVKSEIIKIGHEKVKQLDGGIYEELSLLRKSINKICEDNSFAKPEELVKLNQLFE